MNRIFTFLFLFVFMGVWGQDNQITGGIKGQVISDEDKKSIPNVNIVLANTIFGTAADKNGYFEIKDVPSGNYEIVAKAIGYEEARSKIEVVPGRDTDVIIRLSSINIEMPQITILSDRKGIFSKVPGSVTYIDKKEISRIDPVSGNEVIRRTPGVHVVDEEGAGMRVNIGIRGLDPSRSRSVLVLEDGIPVALAPYGEPEMYYSPAMDRMEGVEIIKGSGSILYGPQTIGGVLNYITADPPSREKGSVSVRGGEGGFFTGMASYGNTYGKAGVQINYLRKQADNLGATAYRINNLTSKLRMELSKKSVIGIKLGLYDEESNSTYVGLTQTMFDAGGQDFVRIAPEDRLAIRMYSASITHNYYFNSTTKLNTTLYGYTTTRNWKRQDFAYNRLDENGDLLPPPSNFTGVVWGDESVDQGALYMRNSTGNRNRQFEVGGLESRLSKKYEWMGFNNELTVGGRFLFERAFEQRINGSKFDAESGLLRDDEVRTGYGTSGYVHNRFDITSRFSVTAGVRTEYFTYERDIRRGTYNGQIVDTSIIATSGLLEIIPGAGFNFNIHENIGIFGGVHRGYAPPRIKDAISSEGDAYQLDAELSWNYELGSRGKLLNGVGYEVTGFYMDFSNQIIPVAEAAGGAGVGLVNGGATVHAGIETGLNFEINKLAGMKDLLLLSVSATYVSAYFSADRFLDQDDSESNIKGNRTPYAPELLLSTGLTYEMKSGLGIRVTSTYVSEQFADISNTLEPSNNGRTGVIPAYHVLDGSLRYRWEKINTVFSLSVKNITNERYIVNRRPQGIRVGLPRFITGGIQFNF